MIILVTVKKLSKYQHLAHVPDISILSGKRFFKKTSFLANKDFKQQTN